jgi:hypothetical protein
MSSYYQCNSHIPSGRTTAAAAAAIAPTIIATYLRTKYTYLEARGHVLFSIWVVFVGTIERNAGFTRRVPHHFLAAVVANDRDLEKRGKCESKGNIRVYTCNVPITLLKLTECNWEHKKFKSRRTAIVYPFTPCKDPSNHREKEKSQR